MQLAIQVSDPLFYTTPQQPNDHTFPLIPDVSEVNEIFVILHGAILLKKLATVFSSNVEGFTLLSQYLTLKKKYISLKDKTKQSKTQVLDDLPDLQTKKLSALTVRTEWL